MRSGGERGGDLLSNRPWHPHDACLVGLHRTPLQTTDLHRGLDHPSRAAKQIQPTDPERDQLAGTQARIGSKQDERPVSELGHRREPLDLFCIRPTLRSGSHATVTEDGPHPRVELMAVAVTPQPGSSSPDVPLVPQAAGHRRVLIAVSPEGSSPTAQCQPRAGRIGRDRPGVGNDHCWARR